MPGGKRRELRGLRFQVRPRGLLRRRLRFPFFFEQTNYSFDIDVERMEEPDPQDPWPDGLIAFAVMYENGFVSPQLKPVPPLTVGQKTTLPLDEIYVSHPGQTLIVIVGNPHPQPDERMVTHELYSYRVRTEESLWVSVAAILFAGASLFAAFFVPIYTASLGEPPVVNEGPIIINVAATPTVALTITPDASPQP